MTAAGILPKRFSSLPTTSKQPGNHQQPRPTGKPSTKPTGNPFSFNNYAFKPAPQPSHQPFDPADLTRRLEHYLASLEQQQPADATATAAAASATPSKQQHANQHLKPQSSQPRSAAAAAGTSSAQSPASPTTPARYHHVAAPKATRSATDPLPTVSTRPAAAVNDAAAAAGGGDKMSLEALRREARRAQRRSAALRGAAGGAPVEAGELARRLSALNGGSGGGGGGGGDGSNAAGASLLVLKTRTSLPEMKNGQLKRVSSARANEKRAVVRRGDGGVAGGRVVKVVLGEGERAAAAAAATAAAKRSGVVRRSTVHGAGGGVGRGNVEMWRVFVDTQNAMTSNSQAVAAHYHHSHRQGQSERRKSRNARRPRPLSTTALELDQARWSAPGSAKVLQKSRSSGFAEAGSSTNSDGSKVEYALGRRPDWSQRDEEDREGRLSPLHLYVPGFGRRSSTSITEASQSEDERALSDVEGKRRSAAINAKNNRKSGGVGEVTGKESTHQKRPPSMLQIPSSNSNNSNTLQISPSSSLARSPASPPSITLSPVDFRISLDLHPGFSPNLSPLQPASPYEARAQSTTLDRKPSQPKPTLDPLPEVQPLPAPDRFSKTRPKSFVAQQQQQQQRRSNSTPLITKSPKAQKKQPPAPSGPVPWPGPQQKTRGRGAGAGGPLSSNPISNSGATAAAAAAATAVMRPASALSLFPAEDERMKKRKSVVFAEQVEELRRPNTSYHAPTMTATATTKKDKSGGRREKGDSKVKEREAADRERGGGVMSPTRLVFWRRDSAVATAARGDEGRSLSVAAAVDQEAAVVRSPSRLAFWKRRGTAA